MSGTSVVDRGAGASNSEDVVKLILADHREFERLMRELRNRENDRVALRKDLADLLVAHAEAEEDEVYPKLKRKAPEEAEEIEHGSEEHTDGHEALLTLLEIEDVDSDDFEEALEELVETVNHHLDEEERDVLNAARENVEDEVRAELGRAFLRRRAEVLDGPAGDPDHVRSLIERDRGES